MQGRLIIVLMATVIVDDARCTIMYKRTIAMIMVIMVHTDNCDYSQS